MTYRVSVVVPTFKRPDLLNRCLTALLVQNFDKADYEVIVVDDAPSDDTKQLVERFAEQIGTCGPRLRYIPVGGSSEQCHPERSEGSGPPPIDRHYRKST